jgi:hypothetical protein
LKYFLFSFFLFSFVFLSCDKGSQTGVADQEFFYYSNYLIDGENQLSAFGASLNPSITVSFSEPVDLNTVRESVSLSGHNAENIQMVMFLTNQDSTLNIQFEPSLSPLQRYSLQMSKTMTSVQGRSLFSDLRTHFSTTYDPSDKFPFLSDDDLLTHIQEQTFKYFWDFGHPVSGMARERNTSGDLVTSGGTGFGIMSIIVGIERGFITREEGRERINKIASFLDTKATKYHGAFAHWMNGVTGQTIPFSPRDDGGDLVETSFLIAGFLCAREYFDRSDSEETELRETITRLWEGVEWSWYTKNGGSVLFWHWSPNHQWAMNLPVRGWNECLITYILAAASPTFPVSEDVYNEGWARQGGFKNGREFFGTNLPLGPDYGGPLFFEHYSFLGINPKNLKDKYANYWQQAVSHTLINQKYCVANPKNYYGYNEDCWGLTASDTRTGYTAHSPSNDQGVITPTAALSSIPFAPEESMKALRFFYYKLGDKLFKEYGFIDAFSLHHTWFADSFLAIDQGPIIIMIENQRTQLIWNYTMKSKDIQNGLTKLGFEY